MRYTRNTSNEIELAMEKVLNKKAANIGEILQDITTGNIKANTNDMYPNEFAVDTILQETEKDVSRANNVINRLKELGYTVTGEMPKSTETTSDSHTNMTDPKLAPYIKIIQQFVGTSPDGKWGKDTEAKIKAYEKKKGKSSPPNCIDNEAFSYIVGQTAQGNAPKGTGSSGGGQKSIQAPQTGASSPKGQAATGQAATGQSAQREKAKQEEIQGLVNAYVNIMQPTGKKMNPDAYNLYRLLSRGDLIIGTQNDNWKTVYELYNKCYNEMSNVVHGQKQEDTPNA